MNYLRNEEKKFKSYLKKKVSFDLQTLVKFLITGVVAVSVTACGGGGGGGGGSSSNVQSQKPTVVQEENSFGNLITVNEKYTNKGNITLSNSSVGIIGSNSDIVNEGDISSGIVRYFTTNGYPEINFETSLAKIYYKVLQEMGVKAGIIAEKGSVLNNGTIKLEDLNGTEGLESWGIIGIYSNITNNGTIKTINNSVDSVGIMNLGGDTINNGEINLVGDDSIGIYVANKLGYKFDTNNGWLMSNGDGRAQVINNGKIVITGGKSQIGINAEGKNIDILNSENGIIKIVNNYTSSNSHYLSSGISRSYDADELMNEGNATITNKGTINVSSNISGNNGIIGNAGIYTVGDKTTIVNSGNISNSITLEHDNTMLGAYSFGILVDGNETIINNSGNIDIKVIDNSVSKESNKTLIAGVVNLSPKKNTINNGGNITVTGKKYNGELEEIDSNILGGGIFSTTGDITNSGTITVTGDKMFGIYGGENSTITNNKDIKLDGNYVAGIKGNNSQITNNGNILISSDNNFSPKNTTLLPKITYETGKSTPELILGATASIGIDGENSEIVNNGSITMNGNRIVGIYGYDSKITTGKNSDITLTGRAAIGIYGANNSNIINNGNIAINVTENSDIGSTGILLEGNGSVENKGTIDINGNKVLLPTREDLTPEELEQLVSKISTGISIENTTEENMVVNTSTGTIRLSGSAIGIYSKNSNVENAGMIDLGEENFQETEIPTIGMGVNGGEGINNGEILGRGNSSQGMFTFNGGTIINGRNGVINLTGNEVEGMSVDTNGIAINKGKIIVEGYRADGIDADSGKGENYGTITVIGEDASGMRADAGGTVINQVGATINVKTGANGMVASGKGSRAENYGTINVTADAQGGMRAWDGGTIINQAGATINVDKNHSLNGMHDKEQVAIFADESSEIKNYGTINTNGEVKIKLGSSYTVGTNSDGTFGKLTASDVNLNGNLVISTDMVKGSYEESYKLDNMIEGENINLGEEYKNLSNSLLYDAKTSKDEEGNLDGELVRNNNSISDFTSNHLTQVGELFDKYLSKENYEKLSQEDKKLVDKIFASTGSATDLKDTIGKVSGQEYLNISRQIFDIKDSFRKYDTSVISTLDRYDYNFTLIGEYGDIQSKDGVLGYDTKMTGFNGAMRLADNLYGTLGYGYSDIDYDNSAEGKIQTIHAGLYRDYSYNKSNIRVGTFGEYNFHETDRENLDGYVNTDYNSYLVGITGEISKKYGDTLYIQPRLALDVAYGNVENFSEENLEIKEQDYTSVLPKAELIVGKKLNNIELFAKSSYSYELGNLDKDMDIKLLNNTVGIDNDTMDKGNLDLSIGTELNFESLSLNAELGKEFGKRDREYIKAGITYKF